MRVSDYGPARAVGNITRKTELATIEWDIVRREVQFKEKGAAAQQTLPYSRGAVRTSNHELVRSCSLLHRLTDGVKRQ